MSDREYFCPQCGHDPDGADVHQKNHHMLNLDVCHSCGVGDAEPDHYCRFDEDVNSDCLADCEKCNCCIDCQNKCADEV